MNGTKRRRGGSANNTTAAATRKTRLVVAAVKPVEEESETETPPPKTAATKKNTKQQPITDFTKPADDDDPLSDLHHLAADKSDSWETESLFEDIIDDLTQDKVLTDIVDDACTTDETVYYRQLLRTAGPEQFCRLTVEDGKITAKKLLTAFGVIPPPFLEGSPDDEYYGLLTLALSRELKKRAKLMNYNTVGDAVNLIYNAKNIVVLTGAGISTSLGIPDFRSKDTGLYAQLAQQGLAINDPQEVFDIRVFNEDPTIFFTVAKDILPSHKKFTPTHAFIAMLQNKGKLLTNYSQNIDNIEANAGILPEKLVQCHGSFATATCQKCGHRVVGDEIYSDIRAGQIPRCLKCIKTLRGKGKAKRKRSSNRSSSRRLRGSSDDDDDDDFNIPSAGIMKPDITFFGEDLPTKFRDRLGNHDRDLVDLVIVIGTSLKVTPVSEMSRFLPPNVPQIYISRDPVSHINFDIDLLGDCDVVVAELCRQLGWNLQHEMINPDQKVRVKPEEGYNSRHRFSPYVPPPESGSLKREEDE
ncbi:Sir2 family protein [Apiospora hydei]|uniref:Sir2 family protein n=1 Tax=Apiospora hydei TaxID=1337664 RepID=A0ABR1WM65_9PEZI